LSSRKDLLLRSFQAAKKAATAAGTSTDSPAITSPEASDAPAKKRKLVESNGGDSHSAPLAAPVMLSPAYEVESIVARKVNEETAKNEYLIKWKGYQLLHSIVYSLSYIVLSFSPDQNTWEPEEHLIGCAEMLVRFNAKVFSIHTTRYFRLMTSSFDRRLLQITK
jgi:hypothetical protein